MRKIVTIVLALGLFAGATAADEVIETLESAIAAYREGDISYATEELGYAQQLLKDMRAGELNMFLPAAPEGWTRAMDTDAAMGFAMMGGGTAAAATYSDGEGSEFTITIALDSPMLAMVAPMIQNAAIMGLKLERVGREKFANQDGELMGLIEGRVFITAERADTETMIAALEKIDFDELGRFGR